jgi:AraC family transcriptional regulator
MNMTKRDEMDDELVPRWNGPTELSSAAQQMKGLDLPKDPVSPREPWELPRERVKICPSAGAKRQTVEWHGLASESLYLPGGRKIEVRLRSEAHLLILYHDGSRAEGETAIEGMRSSALRNFGNKLTFVLAGHAYSESFTTTTPVQITYLHLDPAEIYDSRNVNALYVSRILFDDAVIWNTATKLKGVIEAHQTVRSYYLEALAKVLGYELSRLDRHVPKDTLQNRGGLAGWQMRAVTEYIEQHLSERLSLAMLAQRARLSEQHFCRAFKQSFGIPPHQYLLHRRIETAKSMLADLGCSVTEVGLSLGYSQTSSFSAAFRKVTGFAPREFRRNFA